ncbi:hypothetical protein [Paraglaciecola chathamensis]|uniref:hypothetical protein n=1 Tax=Paraglaciecola chathamensis TaxID=368405 RepID=UPI00363DFA4C
MIIILETVKDYDFNNTGAYNESLRYYKIFWKDGEKHEVEILQEEYETLESKGFTKTTRDNILHLD